MLTKWTIGELQQTSFNTKNMTKNIRKSMQKPTGSSWMPPLLSKIVPYVSNASRRPGALKVSLTLKGWVPSLPIPSGAYALPMKKMMMTGLSLGAINMGANSEEEVMKWQSRLSQEDD
jgi:hypothetical protein